MVELSGFQPRFSEMNESAEDAVGDKSLHAVLVDCDHPEFSEKLIGSRILRELRALGYDGHRSALYRYLEHLKAAAPSS